MKGTRLRRLFYRPDELVVGYDEGVLQPQDIRRVRDIAPIPLRTMPFRRGEPDPGAPVLLTLGSFGGREDLSVLEALGSEQWREVWRRIAGALAAAVQPPLRTMVRFNYRRVIIRGDVQAATPEDLINALTQLPLLAKSAVEAAEGLPPETQLLTARFDPQAGQWILESAYGYQGRKWVRRFDSAREEWVEMRERQGSS